MHLIGATNIIEVTGLKFCLSFLRCFGCKITRTIVIFSSGVEQSKEEYLDQYIKQYCADTLTGISFADKSGFSNEAFAKPFKNVESVEIACDLTGETWSNFANWFPNMLHLDVNPCYEWDTATMKVRFPHLEHLFISVVETDEHNEKVMKIIESNPQLQSLHICTYFEMPFNTFLTKIHANTSITKLRVYETNAYDVETSELERLMAEHPLIVELDLAEHRLTADEAINFIRQMKALKRIVFDVHGRSDCDRIMKELEGEWKSKVEINRWGNSYVTELMAITIYRVDLN